jgi:hypothetical protein
VPPAGTPLVPRVRAHRLALEVVLGPTASLAPRFFADHPLHNPAPARWASYLGPREWAEKRSRLAEALPSLTVALLDRMLVEYGYRPADGDA